VKIALMKTLSVWLALPLPESFSVCLPFRS